MYQWVTQVSLEVTMLPATLVLPTAVVREQVFTRKKNTDTVSTTFIEEQMSLWHLKKINI
jgi:hypothetical protein